MIKEMIQNGYRKVKTFVVDNSKKALATLGFGVAAGAVSQASAQTNSFPDPTVIYSGLASPFNSALSWVIGAIAVLTLIGWILVAVRRRK